MKKALLIGVDIVVLCAFAFVWWRYVPLRDGVYVVGNDKIAWRIVVKNGVLGTASFENPATGARLALAGDDFVLRLGTAKSIGWMKDYQKPTDQWPPLMVRDGRMVTPSRCRPLWLIRGLSSWRIILLEPSLNCTVELQFDTRRGEPWIRRRIVLTPREPNALLAIDGALHARWHTAAAATRGGMGQPVFLDGAWFVGLEHPWSVNSCSNGVLALQQFPGHQFDSEGIRLQSMVVGTGPAGGARIAMDRYVATIRRPPRSLALYNTWCDLRGDELTQDNIEKSSKEIARNLERYGAKLDVIAVDDGWFVPKSIWECDNTKMPNGLVGLRKSISACGMGLGIWLPLSGLNLDTTWGEQRGYEITGPKYYCISGTNYNRALRQRLRAVIDEGNMRYFKHDFNFFWCGKTHHGHFPSKEQSTEANLDAEFSLLNMESERQPNIFLAVTTGTWPSPWWLAHADAIWMGGSDHDFDRTQPSSHPSVFEMNYRDGALYALMVEQGVVFPLQALMTHGIVDARHTPYNVAQEDDEGWANYVMNYLGRGTMMREFYVSPDNLAQKRWQILARGLSWARSLDPCMAHAHFVLGDPRKGEMFGYVGTDGAARYASLRNPGLASAAVPLKSLGFSNALCEIVYPWHEWVDARATPALDVPGEAVLQAMDCPGGAPPRPVPLGVRAELVSNTPAYTAYTLYMPFHMDRFDIVSPVRLDRVEAESAAKVTVTDNGRRVRVVLNEVAREARFDVENASFDPHGVFHCSARMAGPVQGKIRVVVRNATPVTPIVTINGKPALVETINGPGWLIATARCVQGTNDLYFGFRGAGMAASTMTVQAFALRETAGCRLSLRIRHDTVRVDEHLVRPVPLLQETMRTSLALAGPVSASFDVRSADMRRPHSIAEKDLAAAKYAWLKLEVYDVNGGKYADKRVAVNGELIGLLATNPAPVATWHEAAMELPDKAVRAIALDNVVSVEDKTGDAYKVRRLRLVVELADGRQVSTDEDPSTYSSNMQWPHAEGNKLALDGSPAFTLSF